jgi:hypothetical protein
MASILIKAPTGWNKWIYAATTFSVDGQTVNLPDSSFPVVYTPASAFWVRSLMDHCDISWLNVLDPFSAFLLGGGATGTFLGVLSGLGVVGVLVDLFTAGGSFGLFPQRKGTYGPRFGFCISNSFKQQVFVRFDIQNALSQVLLLGSAVELMENSRFKRLYVYEGEIVTHEVTGSQHILRLDINKLRAPTNIPVIGSKILIIQPDGNSFSLTIQDVKDNWDLIVSDPGEVVPQSGDYYKLDQTWVIEDPALISGFLVGNENEAASEGVLTSGSNLFVSDQNKPYEEGKFLGVYIWKDKPVIVTTTTTTTGATGTETASEESAPEITEETTTTTTTETLRVQPSYGSNMSDSALRTWAFYGFGNSDASETYSNDDRYKENIMEDIDENGSISRYTIREVATDKNYQLIQSDNGTEYIRTEISSGGYVTRNNWHARCLEGSYIKINGATFKILAHVEANIIDIAINSVDGKARLDPKSVQNYSVFNQYSWMINENYLEDISDSSTSGLFAGNVIAISDKEVTVLVEGDPSVLTGEKFGYSLESRYKNGVEIPSVLKKAFERFQDWRLVILGSSEYPIDNVVFGDKREDGWYEMTVNLVSIPDGLTEGTKAYISFDRTFSSVSNYGKRGLGINLSVAGGVSNNPDSPFDKSSFIVSDVICLDGDYLSAPYSIDIPIDARYGICDGQYFGIAANGSSSKRGAQLSLLSTPRSARGIASMFHALRQEDWVVYEDPINGKITVRRGSDGFTDYPEKSLIAIGKPSLVETMNGNPITLNEDQDYLRRLQMTVPIESGGDTALLFGIGGIDNTYGFYVSGDGIVDLGFSRKQGIESGEVDSNFWTNDGYDVSPVYLYQRAYYQQLENRYVDIGVETDKGPIYVKESVLPIDVSNIIAEYVKENQLLDSLGYFDVIRKNDGENILIYGQSVGAFTVNENLNNSSDNTTAWKNKSAVFIVGTYDEAFIWAAPTSYRIDDEEDKNQHALMILNSCDFLSSIYNPMNETFSIFCRCYQGDSFYIGNFIVSTYNLLSDGVNVCTPSSEAGRKFLWRHPSLEDSFVENESRSWTNNGSLINDGLSYDPTAARNPEDEFIKVMGSGVTNSQVQNASEFGIISTSILPDGSYMLLYDTEGGVKPLFSLDSGYSWIGSNIILAKNARDGVLVGRYLFYITSSGIEVKLTDYADFYLVSDLAAGISTPGSEIDTQESLDLYTTKLIGSGAIDPQRLSGYVTSDGIIKMFFYDQNQLLKCIESRDGFEWKTAKNF